MIHQDSSPGNNTCDGQCSSCFSNSNTLIAHSSNNTRQQLDENRVQLNYKKGELIFKKGLHPQGVFCLSRGKVMVTQSDSNGNTIITQLLNGVEFVGLADFFAKSAYQTSAVAMEDSVLCFFSNEIITKAIKEDSGFVNQVMEALSRHYIDSNQRILTLTKKNMRARVAKAIIELNSIFGITNDGFIDVYLKRSEIGMLCNMSEANVIRMISDLNKQGVILSEGKRIKIENAKLLLKESNY